MTQFAASYIAEACTMRSLSTSSSMYDAIIITRVRCDHHHDDNHQHSDYWYCNIAQVSDIFFILDHIFLSFYLIASLSYNNNWALNTNDPFICEVCTILSCGSRIDEELSCLFSSIPGWASGSPCWPAFLQCGLVAELPTPVGPTVASSSLCWEQVKPATLSNNLDQWSRPG